MEQLAVAAALVHRAGSAAADNTVQHAALRAIEDIDSRYSSTAVAAQAKAAKMAEPARTLLIDKGDVEAVIQKAEEATAASAKLDISTLKSGDVIEGRYKFIEKIGT